MLHEIKDHIPPPDCQCHVELCLCVQFPVHLPPKEQRMKLAGKDGAGLLAAFILEDMHGTSTLFFTSYMNDIDICGPGEG